MLTVKRKQEIEKIAESVLLKYNITECPAKHLSEIMKKENILFFKDSFDDNNFDGLITLNNDNQYCIYINTRIYYPPRHNFTIAHELGHYFLGHKLNDGSLICDRYNISEEDDGKLNSVIEQEANYFAACLLMPKNMFIKSFVEIMQKLNRNPDRPMYVDNQECNYKDWKTMFHLFYADFRISIMALKFRLEEFGLIKFNWYKETWIKCINDYFDVSYLK